MAARYPSNLVTVTQMPDTRGATTVAAVNHVSDHNQAAFEIIAIEAELNSLPKGGFEAVNSRISANQGHRNIQRMLCEAGATGGIVAQNYPIEGVISQDLFGGTSDPYDRPITNQRLSLSAVWLPGGAIIDATVNYCTTAASGSGNLVVATTIHSTDGSTLTKVADGTNGAQYNSTGYKVMGLSTPYTVPAAGGIYYIGTLWATSNANTPPSLLAKASRAVDATLWNPQTNASWPRFIIFSTIGPGGSSDYASLSIASGDQTRQINPWVGVRASSF